MCVCGWVGVDSKIVIGAFLGHLYFFEKEAEEHFVNYMGNSFLYFL